MSKIVREWKVSKYGDNLPSMGISGGKLQTVLNRLEEEGWNIYKVVPNTLGEVIQIISFRMKKD